MIFHFSTKTVLAEKQQNCVHRRKNPQWRIRAGFYHDINSITCSVMTSYAVALHDDKLLFTYNIFLFVGGLLPFPVYRLRGGEQKRLEAPTPQNRVA
jgi:hypothetical protein